MREKRTLVCETNDFKAKALRWADENCKGDSMTKMARKVGVEFGVEIKGRTWRRWYKDKKTEILATADNESELGSTRKSKHAVLHSEMKLFKDQLNEKCKSLYQRRNLTMEQISVEAAALKPKYPDLKLNKTCVFGRKWVENFCKEYGWSWRRILGRQKVLNETNLSQIDKEFSTILNDYSDENVFNLDESSLLTNSIGSYSMQKKGENQPREVNNLNDKERLTFMVGITKSGEKVFDVLILDKAKPHDLKCKKICDGHYSSDDDKKRKNYTLYRAGKDQLFATTKKGFTTRLLFRKYLHMINTKLAFEKRKMCLLLDNYPAHHFKWDTYKNWRRDQSKLVYTDSTTFTNLLLAYLPVNSTGAVQPADLGPNSYIQLKYQKSWNECENKDQVGRGAKIMMAFQSINLLDKSTIRHAWNESKLTSLNTNKEVNEETANELTLADSAFGENLESEFFEVF